MCGEASLGLPRSCYGLFCTHSTTTLDRLKSSTACKLWSLQHVSLSEFFCSVPTSTPILSLHPSFIPCSQICERGFTPAVSFLHGRNANLQVREQGCDSQGCKFNGIAASECTRPQATSVPSDMQGQSHEPQHHHRRATRSCWPPCPWVQETAQCGRR